MVKLNLKSKQWILSQWSTFLSLIKETQSSKKKQKNFLVESPWKQRFKYLNFYFDVHLLRSHKTFLLQALKTNRKTSLFHSIRITGDNTAEYHLQHHVLNMSYTITLVTLTAKVNDWLLSHGTTHNDWIKGMSLYFNWQQSTVYFLSSYVHEQQSSAGKDADLLLSIKNNSNIYSAFKISFLLYLFPKAPLLIFCLLVFNRVEKALGFPFKSSTCDPKKLKLKSQKLTCMTLKRSSTRNCENLL